MKPSAVQQVYDLVASIPPGEVTTYGAIAKQAGVHPRQVGRLLHDNPDPGRIPCHRVVNAAGRVAANFAFGGATGQIRKLQDEGVAVQNGRVTQKPSLA